MHMWVCQHNNNIDARAADEGDDSTRASQRDGGLKCGRVRVALFNDKMLLVLVDDDDDNAPGVWTGQTAQ